jgi:hypothetical protein
MPNHAQHYIEFVENLLEIIEKGFPFGRCDPEMLVRVLHGTTGIILRPGSRPADHFCDQILKTCRRNTMMGLVYLRVRVQTRINHNPVNEVTNNGFNLPEQSRACQPPISRACSRFSARRPRRRSRERQARPRCPCLSGDRHQRRCCRRFVRRQCRCVGRSD